MDTLKEPQSKFAAHQALVSVILPVRNEAAFIERNLAALAAQTYPKAALEVLVVDGQSDDGTPARVDAFAAAHGGLAVRRLDNPQRSMPAGFNVGLAASRGEVVIVVGGHCTLAPDYVARCVEALARTGADCVGGLIETVGETAAAQAIAAAQSSPFGVGGATFRMADAQPGYVDTVAFGAYRREVFGRIGGLDEELVRNQDDEFNFRLTQAGGKIWLDPAIRATYYSRSSLRKLWTQYYDYGLYKVRVIQKRGAVPSWRHLAPGSFVLATALGLGLYALTRRKLFLAPLVAYTAANLAFSLATGLAQPPQGKRPAGRGILPYLPWAFAILHFAYGLGFLAGLWRWRRYGLPSLRVAQGTSGRQAT
jgi:glycosyltransferase involved in cell wall biosynthesis